MIILQDLTVQHFRRLQEMNLHFPRRGSMLISGSNEAGKSTVFESIYFALYGEPLSSEAGRRAHASLDDVIRYGEHEASVTLTLSIGATELLITRRIVRGEGQSIRLYVRRLGMPEEGPITQLGVANERIIAELGGMDGETLRNSCLIEQGGLDRLERLSRNERESTLRKLLGIEKLTQLAERFTLTEDDERLLTECTQYLALAEVQARIPKVSEQLGEIEAALDAVTITEDLAELSQQQAEIAEQRLALEQVQARRLEMKEQQNRIAQLKKGESILGEIIAAYDAIAEAQHELPDLEGKIAELVRRESEELPGLEKRVRDVSDLTRSFSALERMAADLLLAVNRIKELEQELQQYERLQVDLEELDEQVIPVRLQLEQAQQTQHELEELSRLERPQLEARLRRLQELSECVTTLLQLEEKYVQQAGDREQVEQHIDQFDKVRRELHDAEAELAVIEAEAEQTEALEKNWRQLSIRHQLEEWRRLKGLIQKLEGAEQHVVAAHAHQEQLTRAALTARSEIQTQLIIFIACAGLFVLFGSSTLVLMLHHAYLFALTSGVVGLLLAIAAGLRLQNYTRVRAKERMADEEMQKAIRWVQMVVEAREAILRAEGSKESQDRLSQVEHEMQSLGSPVPRSLHEAEDLLKQLPDADESVPRTDERLANIEQQVVEKQTSAHAARDSLNMILEAVAALHKEYARLEQQRQEERWDDFSEKLREDALAIEQMRQEIIILAGQEGLPLSVLQTDSPDFLPLEERFGQLDRSALPLKAQVEDRIQLTEQEMAMLDKKLREMSDLAAQVKLHQDTLDMLLARKKNLMERAEYFKGNNPLRQLERARERQVTLRDALKTLQDSLRQRVQSLGVSFGQAAISSEEAAARKSLEALQVTLGARVELQNRHMHYTALLKHQHEALSDYYAQLAKLSSSLGSWIVPLNPFPESLVALRERYWQEIREAGEDAILGELEVLRLREGASKAKIELCEHEIEEARERIATMLAQRNRPQASAYTLANIAGVWPLVGEYSPEDRNRLEDECEARDIELRELEEQELRMSEQLGGGRERIDLEQARYGMEQQERRYATKKLAGSLVKATTDRMMSRMLTRTEYFIQQLLPVLTCGRYHDVRLTMGQEEAVEEAGSQGAFELSVWEMARGAYIPRSALSAGAADQVSLALRLAFTIAALPDEVATVPGFLLLDEPLGSFDRDHVQAMVDMITGKSVWGADEMLGQHFEQMVLVSHNSDAAQFPYSVSMDDGVVVESNLPPMGANAQEGERDDSEDDVYVPVAASIGGE